MTEMQYPSKQLTLKIVCWFDPKSTLQEFSCPGFDQFKQKNCTTVAKGACAFQKLETIQTLAKYFTKTGN